MNAHSIETIKLRLFAFASHRKQICPSAKDFPPFPGDRPTLGLSEAPFTLLGFKGEAPRMAANFRQLASACVVILALLFANSGAVAEALRDEPSVAADVIGSTRSTATVTIAATGSHPDGTQWDGRRIFWLPVEMTTASPPDIELCIAQIETITCMLNGAGSLCPDSDRCTFRNVTFDQNRPFGLIVFDYDGFAENVVNDMAEGLQVMSETLPEIAQEFLPDDMQEPADTAVTAASRSMQSAAEFIAHANSRRLEWMDNLVLAPDGWTDNEEVEALSVFIRKIVRESASPAAEPFGALRRLEGQFDVRTLSECMWPSPACLLPYVAIEIVSEEN